MKRRKVTVVSGTEKFMVGKTYYTRRVDGDLVYFLRQEGTDLVKIGFSKNPRRRARAMQTGSPHRFVIENVLPGGQELEELLHTYLSKYRVRGEWFRITPTKADALCKTLCQYANAHGVEAMLDSIRDGLRKKRKEDAIRLVASRTQLLRSPTVKRYLIDRAND